MNEHERRPGMAAFAVAVADELRAQGGRVRDALGIAKQLYVNEQLEVCDLVVGNYRTLPNPHVGGKNIDQLPATLKAIFK